MNKTTLYGQSHSDKLAEENLVCRQMVREINNFGITQRQSLLLIYLIALELENTDHMRTITQVVRGLTDDLMLIGAAEPDQEIKGDDNGSSNV